MEIQIRDEILRYAEVTHRHMTPLRRYSGFSDNNNRGEGDMMDLVAKLVLFDFISEHRKVCKVDLTCGTGDAYDLVLYRGGKAKTWNVKTSKYNPFRNGLNLFVKEEEIKKDMNGFIQCFVHLWEENTPPHLHVPGGILKGGKVWNEHCALREIPNTDGHRGVCIPVDKLIPLGPLLAPMDNKF